MAHPDVQREILRAVDMFIAEGRGHPSFRGLLIHFLLPNWRHSDFGKELFLALGRISCVIHRRAF